MIKGKETFLQLFRNTGEKEFGSFPNGIKSHHKLKNSSISPLTACTEEPLNCFNTSQINYSLNNTEFLRGLTGDWDLPECEPIEAPSPVKKTVIEKVQNDSFPENDRKISDQIKSITIKATLKKATFNSCLLYTSPSPRDLSTSRMPSSA
eukprot:TRINITY_DN55221_c0_g1_i1.p1 TRINITY_DN55221_c0_g1~~TRINITY_DN55221_c0_g1_i1.p1  ORF type:complete len:160 (-),score=32.29 TRINITY_DN55221_c0_g1_i1:108-557(-)